MADLNNNGIDESEYKALQSQSVQYKFLMQLCGALAGATFLAVLGVVGKALMESTLAAAPISWPIAIGMMAFGLTCTYLSCRYMNKGNMLDQDMLARKTAAANKSKNKEPEVVVGEQIEAEKPKPYAGILTQTQKAPDESERFTDSEVSSATPWAEKFAERKEVAPALAAKNDDERGWADKLQAAAANDAGREAASPAAARA